MNRKHIITGIIAFSFILGWNVFLIQRDKKLFDSYYHPKVVQVK